MAEPPTASCRLYALLARDRRSAVVFRRGPSKQVAVLRWALDDDQLELGQWFKGRIYERRCDLSADGELLIYFAANWKAPYQSWTAVSRPPYLSALALWPKGDAWGGGGVFLSRNVIGLNHHVLQPPVQASATEPRHSWHPLDAASGKRAKKAEPAVTEIALPANHRVRRWHDDYAGSGEDDPLHSHRLIRDGWTCVAAGDHGPHSNGKLAWEFNSPEIFERPQPAGRLRLRRVLKAIGERNGRWYVEDFEIIDEAGSCLRLIAGCDWADWQATGDLLFARAGCLYRLPARFAHERVEDPLMKARCIADLGPMTFKGVAAPASALSWPK